MKGLFISRFCPIFKNMMKRYFRKALAPIVIAAHLAMAPNAFAVKEDIILDDLFATLQEVQDQGDVARIVSEIWSRWSTHPDDESITSRLNRGVTMMNQGDYVHAEALFTDIIALDPDFAEAWNKRATLYYIQGNLAASRADIAQTLAIEPRHFGALAGLGLIELHLGNDEAALQAYQAAIDINPHMSEVTGIIEKLQEKLRGLAL